MPREVTLASNIVLATAIILTYLLLLNQILCSQHCSCCQIHRWHLRQSLPLCSHLCFRTYLRRLQGLVSRRLSCSATDRRGCWCCRRRIRLLRLKLRSHLMWRCCRRRESRLRCCWWCCYLCCRSRQRLSRCCHCQTRKTWSRLKVRWCAESSMRGPLARSKKPVVVKVKQQTRAPS
jgi:hypothetical protein